MKALKDLRRLRIKWDLKKDIKDKHECPICGKMIEFGVELDALKKAKEKSYYPYPHLHLHGNPLHAVLCYIDKEHKVRGVSGVNSLQIARDADTFGQIMKKWSNPD